MQKEWINMLWVTCKCNRYNKTVVDFILGLFSLESAVGVLLTLGY